jgi:hypothetical protein
MAPPLTRVVALYVGQGMAHLVEMYADGSQYPANPPDRLALIDFGGDSDAADDAVAYVINQLQAQVKAKRTPKFDLTVISHQDKDHLILLGPLTTAITKAKLDISFGTVFLGGLSWSAQNKKVVDDFFGVAKLRPKYAWDSVRRSDYKGVSSRAKLGWLYFYYKTYFRVLVSQLRVPSGGADIIRNASSCVLVIENGENSIILPGDATWQTIDYVNDLYADWYKAKSVLVPQVYAMEVPHHGALRTIVENYKASSEISKMDFAVVQGFAANCNADIVFASAGRDNTHGHPVEQVLEVFTPYLRKTTDHSYVSWQFLPTKRGPKRRRTEGYVETDTTLSIWTTLLKLDGAWSNLTFSMQSSSAGEPAEVRVERVSLRELSAMQNRARGLPVDDPPASLLSSAAPPPAPRLAAAPTDEQRSAATQVATLPRRC